MALNTTQLERYYNAPIGEVYGAVKHYLESGQSRFALKNVDDLSCSCTFSSGISMTTWGENLTASVVPSGEGSLIRLTVAGKLGSTAAGFQSAYNVAIADEFFSGVSATLSVGRTVEVPRNPEQQVTAIADTSLSGDSMERQQPFSVQESPMVSEGEVESTEDSPASVTMPLSVGADTPAAQESCSPKTKVMWGKHKLQIIIAAIVVVAVIAVSAVAFVTSRDNQSDDGLTVVQEVASACNQDNKISVLTEGNYSNNPALQMVWRNTDDMKIVECIASHTNMDDDIVYEIGDSHTSKDNSSRVWGSWVVSWTVDNETEAVDMTIQYLGDDSAAKAKAKETSLANEEERKSSNAQPLVFDLSCYESASDSDTSIGTRITGVTSSNYEDTVWKKNTLVTCHTTGSYPVGTADNMSEKEKEAMMDAYGTVNKDISSLGVLYSLCASTAFVEMGMQTMTSDQAKELVAALTLCPSHPRVNEIKQKAEKDTARESEVASKRQQGLIKDDGTYKVPSEMSTGTWKTMSEKVTNCYWEMQDANGQIYDNNFVSAGIAQTITIPNGVAGFSSQGCGAWEKQ